eukprot:IDg15293t1
MPEWPWDLEGAASNVCISGAKKFLIPTYSGNSFSDNNLLLAAE